MRVLVTGGAGFIGGHVVAALLARGDEVRILDALLPAAWGRSAPKVDPRAEFVRGDVRDASVVRDAVRTVDVVCHQAAMVGAGESISDLPLYAGHNDLGTAVVLAEAAAASVGRVVLASSMVVYGDGRWTCDMHGTVRPRPRDVADLNACRFDPLCPLCDRHPRWDLVEEDAVLDPRSAYAASKVAQEHLASTWARMTGGSVVALRYHNVFGPGMPRDTPYSGVAAMWRSSLERGESPRVFEDGRQMRDFVSVHDVARANLAAIDHAPEGFTAVNVCSGQPRPVLEMARELSAAMTGPVPVVTGEFRLGDVRHVVASGERAAQVIGFRASADFEAAVTEFAKADLR